MKSSLQVKWFGIVKKENSKGKIGKLPKYLLKGGGTFAHYGGVILAVGKSGVENLKKNCAGRKDIIAFEITDKQFGLIKISYNKPATLSAPFTNGIVLEDGDKSIAIPVTKKQMQSGYRFKKMKMISKFKP